MKSLTMRLLAGKYAVARLSPDALIPDEFIRTKDFFSITRTDEEVSVVCREECLPETPFAEKGWRIVKVQGPLDFSLTGILAGLTQPLAQQGISIFAISTYDTDYLLVKEAQLIEAVAALKSEGHQFL